MIRPALERGSLPCNRRSALALVLACAALVRFGADAHAQSPRPDAPANVQASASSKTRVALSWTAPANTGGTEVPLIGYKIEYRTPDLRGGSSWGVLVADTGSTATTYNHDHVIAPGTRLLYRVSAINTINVGDASSEAETTTLSTDTQGNGAPDRTAITVNGTIITITFDENLDNSAVPREVHFRVVLNRSSVSVRPASVAVSGPTVTVTLQDAVDASDTVSVGYFPPRIIVGDAEVPISTKALQDTEGNLVESWNPRLATNNTPPAVKLVLMPDRISENGGVSAVTAKLVPDTTIATRVLTVMVTAEAVAPAGADDIVLSTPATLTIATGATQSTGEVTITAVDNSVRAADKKVTVSGSVSGDPNVPNRAIAATLTIRNDDAPPPDGDAPPATTAPDAPINLVAQATDGVVTLSWEAPEDDGGAAITDYQYRINRRGNWTSIGSTNTTHPVTDLVNDTTYVFEVRAVNRIGRSRASAPAEATPRAAVALDFTHFTNGTGITSEIVLVNVASDWVQPVLNFYAPDGAPVPAASVVDVGGELEIQEDGGLTLRTAMEPLGEVTIRTHGRGELVTGSVKVASYRPIGGFLRFNLPDIGVAGVAASQPITDAIFPARRQEGGINTAAALHNLEAEAMGVSCHLLRGGVALEAVEIPLEANGQTSWFIDDTFTTTDTSDFAGAVRCAATAEGLFTAVALEMDPGTRIFTTLPVFPVPEMPSRE